MNDTANSTAQGRAGVEPIPRAAYLLTGCICVIGANSLVLGPIAPDVAQSFGVATATVMLAAAAFGLGAAVSALFLAHYIDRFGAQRALAAAMSALPIALFASAVAANVTMMIAAQFAAGLISGVALPAVYASATAIAPPGREGKTVSVVLTGWMLSMVGGVSISAFLADLVHWRAVYMATAVLGIVAALLLRRVKRAEDSLSARNAMPISALALTGIKPLLLACITFLTAFYGVYGYLGDYLRHGLGLSLGTNGFVVLAYGLGFGSAVFFDRAIARLGPRRSLPIVLLLVAATYLLLGLIAKTLAAVLVLLALLGLLNHLGINLLIVLLTATDPGKRGAIMGLNSAASNLAVFAGATAFGPIYERHGFAAAAYAATALCLAAVLALASPRS